MAIGHLDTADHVSSLATKYFSAVARRISNAVTVVLAIHAIGLADCRADSAIKQADGTTLSQSVGCAYPTAFGTTAASAPTNHGSAPLDRTVAAGDIPAWRTIALGTPNGVHALRAALKKGCRIGRLADQILGRTVPTVGKSRTLIDLVILSAADLRFDGETTSRTAIYRRARAVGLELCPAEVGPQLRLQYPDQKPGELLHIAMDPVATRRQKHVAFAVGNGGDKLLLVGSDIGPGHMLHSGMRFVFCSRPQSVNAAKRQPSTVSIRALPGRASATEMRRCARGRDLELQAEADVRHPVVSRTPPAGSGREALCLAPAGSTDRLRPTRF